MVSRFFEFLFFPFRYLTGKLILLSVSILDNYLPHFAFLISLFTLLGLILIDPMTSYYAYLKSGMTDKVSIKFSSKDSYETALDVLWTTAFIYLIKTDGQFIDKFIQLLNLLKTNVGSVKSSLINKIKREERK